VVKACIGASSLDWAILELESLVLSTLQLLSILLWTCASMALINVVAFFRMSANPLFHPVVRPVSLWFLV
jgi:hypothetical protein